MLNIRQASIDDRADFLEFANEVFFKSEKSKNFSTLLPKIFLPQNINRASNYLAYDEKEKIVGMATLCPLKMKSAKNVLKVGYIGTVSVSEAIRGRGIMRKIMEHILEESKKKEYDYLYLDGTRQRYGYYGFSPAGERIKVTITKSNVFHGLKNINTGEIEFIELSEENKFSKEALSIHEKRKIKFERTNPGFATIALSFGGQGYLVLKRGQIIGYLIKDSETGDITDIFCENEDNIYGLIKTWIKESEPEKTVVHVPPYEIEILKRLTDISELTEVEVAGKVRIINYYSVINSLLDIKSRYVKLSDNIISLKISDETELTIKVNGNNIEVLKGIESEPIVLDTVDAGRFLLDPFAYSLRENVHVNWFPLPLYIPRADSI